MKLRDLEARFVRYESRPDGEYQLDVASLAEAQGVVFLCPVCFEKNGGTIGTHGIAVTFEGRGATAAQGSSGSAGQPTRWVVAEGSVGIDDLTLAPSIALQGGCAWHGFVRGGEAV